MDTFIPNDHDLLVAINTKLDLWIPEIKMDIGDLKAELGDLRTRLTVVERTQDRQAGFFAGGKALWAFLTALPSGALGLLLGKYVGL